jgi:hypothetical protein
VVVGRGPVAHEVRAVRQPLAFDRAVVLDRDRHAGERALVAGTDRVGGGQRLVVEDVDERVQARVEEVDAPERGLDEVAGGHLAGPDEPGELERGAEQEVVGRRGGVGHRRRRLPTRVHVTG